MTADGVDFRRLIRVILDFPQAGVACRDTVLMLAELASLVLETAMMCGRERWPFDAFAYAQMEV